MKLSELCSYLDSVVPISFQEDYDNSGLQVGLPSGEISSALVTLEVTEEVVDEAISEDCDVIVSHHPLIFRGLKRITNNGYVERTVYKAVKNDIAIYSSHTNLDFFDRGVSRKMAEKLELKSVKVLSPLKGRLLKLVTYIPIDHLDKVRKALFKAGAGKIGNYDECGFFNSGTGSFRAGKNTEPYVGKRGETHYEEEIRLETIMLSHQKAEVVRSLLRSHPYEEAAYDIYPLENDNVEIGSGCTGEFVEPVNEDKFIALLSSVFDARGIKYSRVTGKDIKKVALCGGSGAALIDDAIASGVDAFVTSDIKYHDFFKADGNILLIDLGHFESEKFSAEILYELITKKFPKFAVRFSKTYTNPINYLQ